MSQMFEKEKFYKNSNRLTHIVTAFIMFVCLFSMTSAGFVLYNQYALFIDLIFLATAFFAFGSALYMDKKDFFYILFLLVCFLLTLPFTGGGIGSMAEPLMTVLGIQIMRRCKLTKSLVHNMTGMFGLLFIVCLLRCPSYFVVWTVGGSIGMNPNTLAILIVLSSAFILILNQNNRTYRKYLLFIPQILLTFWGVLNCKSRASLLMFMVFLIFKYLMPVKMKKSRKVACFICGSCIVVGLLFPVFYVHLYQNSESLQIPVISSLISGKSFFSGRQGIWNNIFVELSKKDYGWLIGIGSKADIRTSGLGPHNAFMLVLMNFGLLGTVVYYCFYLFYIKKIYCSGILYTEQIDFVYLGLAFFMLNFFESVLLWDSFIIIAIFIWGMPQGYKQVRY